MNLYLIQQLNCKEKYDANHSQGSKGLRATDTDKVELLMIIGWGFCDLQNNQGRGRGYLPKPKA